MNLTAGRGPVTARSLNAVATLGVGMGDEIEVLATGPEADRALDAVRALADRGFDEEVVIEEPAAVAARAAEAPAGTLAGVPTSPGVALGPARRFHPPVLQAPERETDDPDAELRALDQALAATAADIEVQRAAVAGRAGAYQASIFDAHRLFLQDEMLLEPVRQAIRDERRAATGAWKGTVEAMAAAWEGLEDEYLRARAADLRSVGLQVLAHLLGVPVPRPRLEGPGILLAPDLAPADTAGLDPTLALGIATAFGGPTSHAAILARSLGIPAVVGLGDRAMQIAEGTALALDGDAGLLHVDPSPDLAAELEGRRLARAEADRVARTEAQTPAVTLDGVSIEVSANVGSPEEISAAVEAGCDGVGLFRTEFLFMDRGAVPTEDEQEAAYRRAAEALDGRPMVVRTLDVGADKPLPYLRPAARGQPVPRRAWAAARARAAGAARCAAPRDPARRGRPPDQGDVPDGRDARRAPRRACSGPDGGRRARRAGTRGLCRSASWSRCPRQPSPRRSSRPRPTSSRSGRTTSRSTRSRPIEGTSTSRHSRTRSTRRCCASSVRLRGRGRARPVGRRLRRARRRRAGDTRAARPRRPRALDERARDPRREACRARWTSAGRARSRRAPSSSRAPRRCAIWSGARPPDRRPRVRAVGCGPSP